MADSMVLCMVLGHSYCFREYVPFIGILDDSITIIVRANVLRVLTSYPFVPHCKGLFPFIKDCADFLEKIISWPRVVGSACLRGDKTFPAPW